MRMWRIVNKGAWPKFHIDVLAETITDALMEFNKREKERGSSADSKTVVEAYILGDTRHDNY